MIWHHASLSLSSGAPVCPLYSSCIHCCILFAECLHRMSAEYLCPSYLISGASMSSVCPDMPACLPDMSAQRTRRHNVSQNSLLLTCLLQTFRAKSSICKRVDDIVRNQHQYARREEGRDTAANDLTAAFK